MDDRRQKNQEQLALPFAGGSEAGLSEASKVRRETESPAGNQRMMEAICERENCGEALKRVRSNQGSPGIDGMTVDELPEYLEQHWPAMREQLLSGTYEPKPVKRVEIPKPDGGVRKLGIPTGAGPVCPAGGATGFTKTVGPDVFRTQRRFSSGVVGPTGGGPGAAVYRRGLRLVR